MKIRLLFLALFIYQLGFPQVTFEAKASKTTLGINERLRIDFKMNEDGDNFTPPDFKGFKVVGGPSQSINNSWINGVRSYSKSYTYYLAPTKKGVFSIGQSSIVVDGAVYKTAAIRITVTGAVDIPKDPNDPQFIASESIHLVAEISKTKPYLNQAVSVVYKLYVAENTGVRNWNELDTPRYDDFWSQNIAVKDLTVNEGQYKGENYRYVVLKKAVLYPQKTGKLILEPLTLDVSVEVPSNRRDIFGRQVMTTTSRTVTAGRRTIDVKPLPEQGRPRSFSGAVGQFEFNVSASKNQLNATEAFNLSVEVKGKGNLKLFKLPKPILPSTLEVYEPEHSEKISTRVSGTTGSINDSYTIVPNEQGQYPIAAVEFSYFDLESESYKTLVSDQIAISVNPNPKNNKNNKSLEKPSKIIISNSNPFSSFKTTTQLEPINKTPFYGSRLFWGLFLGPLVLIPAVMVYTKKQGERALDVAGNKIRKSNKLARKHLGEAKKNIGDKKHFYVALERALHNYLKAKLKIETSELTKDRIQHLLIKKAVLKSDVLIFLKLLESCELARYTPFSDSDMVRDYGSASETINRLDKQVK